MRNLSINSNNTCVDVDKQEFILNFVVLQIFKVETSNIWMRNDSSTKSLSNTVVEGVMQIQNIYNSSVFLEQIRLFSPLISINN